ncbi:hypothetical protein [Saccharopolyspora phatthalungensis]|uniref:Uncharacterized protein n=1 Tax=Saccharopolyspora phatthalungensis TaxID=664693 RepID=A0A840Q8J7_9PSEU|nr:hypothetical protein [Saccharopolyspora phatthalungensis]MBB5158852.1 hypothetical protein [Saccharopolyspora phatthalungensis]
MTVRRDLTETDLLGAGNTQLEALFRASPPGDIPRGPTRGTAIITPGTRATIVLARLVHLFAWQGKVFDRDGRALTNRVGPFDLRAVRATVGPGLSWLDGRECIVIDYSRTSFVARAVRDEIRLVAPDLYFGAVWLRRRRVAWFLLRVPPSTPTA